MITSQTNNGSGGQPKAPYKVQAIYRVSKPNEDAIVRKMLEPLPSNYKIKNLEVVTMTNANLETKIREYREMKRLAEEAQAMADAIADELKAIMLEANETKLIVGEYRLSYTNATRSTLDKKRLEQDLGSLDDYTKTTHYKVFKVA